MPPVSSKEVITIKRGEFQRIGAGIQFEIEGNIFFSNRVRTRGGQFKQVLFCKFVDSEGNHRTTSLSGLKPKKGSEGTYHFDVMNPKTRALIDSDESYYLLTVEKDSIRIAGDV